MKKFTALGANIFAGLFTYGIKKAGFDVLAQLEHGPYGVATAKLNLPSLDIRVGRDRWNEHEFKGKVDFMYTNPPCAAWSTARSGQGGSWEEQLPRLRCVHDCVEAGLIVKPKAWCWESVTNAWRAGHEFVVHQAEKWNDAGYHCTVLLQDNKYIGGKQERSRMFLIAHKHPLVWPKLVEAPTVESAWKEAGVPLTQTAQERKFGKVNLKPDVFQPLWGRLYKMSENYGGYFRRTYLEEGRGPKKLEGRIPSVMVRRLAMDEPAPVMLASGLRLHPTEPRYCTWHEWLALVGLPMDWKTSCGSMGAASQELSRAVMPDVGKWLGLAVKKGLELPAIKGRPTTRLVDLRKPGKPVEEHLWTFEGFSTKPFNPPPFAPYHEKTARGPRAPRVGGPNKPGSGQRIRELLMKGVDADSIVTTIHKEFPGSKATKADVSYNRGKLKRAGEKVP